MAPFYRKCILFSVPVAVFVLIAVSLWLQHHLLNESSAGRGYGAALGNRPGAGVGVLLDSRLEGRFFRREGHFDVEEQERELLMNRAVQLGVRLLDTRSKIFDALMEQQGAPITVDSSIHSGLGEGQPIDPRLVDSDTSSATAPRPPATSQSSPAHKAYGSGRFPRSGRSNANTSLLHGAKHHPILTYTDEQLASTPVDDMIRYYLMTQGDGTCSSDFGTTLVRRWKASVKTVCRSPSYSFNQIGPSIGGRKSSIDCYGIKQNQHAGAGDSFCVMKNVAVKLGLFADDAFIQKNLEDYLSSRSTGLSSQAYLKFPRGFIKGSCALETPQNDSGNSSSSSSLWREDRLPGWTGDWTVRAYESILDNDRLESTDTRSDSPQIECDVWIDNDTIVVQRDTFANFFHVSEDFVNAFLVMGILEWRPNNTQILVTDMYPQGPYWDIWSKAFGSSRLPVLTAGDLRSKFAKVGGGLGHHGGTVCFKSLAIGIYGPASPFTLHSRETPCSSATVMRAYSDFIIRGLGLERSTHYAREVPSKEVVVAYIHRNARSQVVCDDSRSIVPCSVWEGLEDRITNMTRRIANADELVQALRSLQNDSFPNGAVIKFREIDYALLPLIEQIKADLEIDVMVGVHGAGLMHSVFMRDRARLVEVFPSPAWVGNRHYQNMAAWSGRRYFPCYPRRSSFESSSLGTYEGEAVVNVPDVVLMVRKAIATMDLSFY